MKKNLVSICIISLLIVGVSCKKIAAAIFGGFDTTVDLQVTVPVIPVVAPFEVSLGQYSYKFNLDSVVRAKTGGIYNANDVKSIKIKKLDVAITNADALNNISNFQSVRVTIQSNTNTTPAELFSVTFPDTYATSFSTPGNDVELLSYLKGSDITYNLFGKNRRVTTKPLTITFSITLRAS